MVVLDVDDVTCSRVASAVGCGAVDVSEVTGACEVSESVGSGSEVAAVVSASEVSGSEVCGSEVSGSEVRGSEVVCVVLEVVDTVSDVVAGMGDVAEFVGISVVVERPVVVVASFGVVASVGAGMYSITGTINIS